MQKTNAVGAAVLGALTLSALCVPMHAADSWKMGTGRIKTRWAKDVSPANPLPEYPRPQMVRKNWQSLNGLWNYSLSPQAQNNAPAKNHGQILVPYAIESALSGVMKRVGTNQKLWYRRTFQVPKNWNGQKVLLHFGAVDWQTTVWVNGRNLGTHTGGYDGFSFDVTSSLKPNGPQEIVVGVWDPMTDQQARGKQVDKPGGIFYTPTTGIWQTVWMEAVPQSYVEDLKMTPNIDTGHLRLKIGIKGTQQRGVVEVRYMGKLVNRVVGVLGGNEWKIPIRNMQLWTPENPRLYNLRVKLDGNNSDSVDSYFAMRKSSLGKDAQGRTRMMLNNQFVFQVGMLDQGYWPDGITTAPTDAALKYDVEIAKQLGFNMLRKHAKTEPSRWYYHCDKMGVLVWQDMPQAYKPDASEAAKAQFKHELTEMVDELYNHPSIVVWTLFNEGWGQHNTEALTEYLRTLDQSRLLNNASGWTDKNVGDLIDMHKYPNPGSPQPEAKRAAVLGEFGGLGKREEGHMWQADSWGYQGLFENSWQLTKRYQEYMKTVYQLKNDPGLSATVYTQLSDVEAEANGLLSYDRAVIKPDAKIVAAANRGVWLPLPPNPSPLLIETSQDDAQTWRYTTDRPADNWTGVGFNDATWKSGLAPFGGELGGVKTQWKTSDIWVRREINLPAGAPKDLEFVVFHDEDVEIYINGVQAATATGYTSDYVRLPINTAGRAALKTGKNVIAAHVHQTTGGQFFDLGIDKAKPKAAK